MIPQRVSLGKSATVVLSPEDERRLIERWQDGDRSAGDEIVQACTGFVVSVALEYRLWGVPLEDIVQEGMMGLLRGASRFDPCRGCRLVTYAAYWIRAQIREFVVRSYRVVRLGASKGERRALRIYRRTKEQDPEELARQSGVTVARATELLPLLMAREVSFDGPSPRGALAVGDRLAAPECDPERLAVEKDHASRMSEAVNQSLGELPDRDREIMRSRWMTDTPMTLEQLGSVFGISKERVRQLEARAKQRMRMRIEALVGAA